MAIVSAQGLEKTFYIDPILKDVGFLIEAGEKIGLIGNNGSGKTTLMAMLAGELTPDGGSISTTKDLEVGYLAQHVAVTEGASIYDECMASFQAVIELEERLRAMEMEMAHLEGEALEEHIARYQVLVDRYEKSGGYSRESAVTGALRGLGFSEEEMAMPAENLSGGQKSRLALAKLLLHEPDLLLLDEPTNHLDMDSIAWLEKFLKAFKGAVVVISHDRYFLDAIVDRILYLRDGVVKSYQGDYTNFVRRRQEEEEQMRHAYVMQQKEIKRQEEMIKRFASWNREKSVRAARSKQKQLDKMERLEDVKGEKNLLLSFAPATESGRDVLHAEHLSKSFPTKQLFDDVTFPIYKGERVGLIGPNGIGKSTLFKIIMNEIAPTSGEVQLGKGVTIAYFDQEMKTLDANKTVAEELWDRYPKLDRFQIHAYLARFLFTGDDLDKRIGDLSGGEKGRLSLLIIMLSGANFLLLDEPTNHLDIESKESLEAALKDYTGTILTISHDRYFLDRVATKIVCLSEEGTFMVDGDYTYFLKKWEDAHTVEEEEEEITKTQIVKEKKKSREEQKEARRRKKALRDTEAEIHALEAEIESMDETLADPATYEDHRAALELSQKRDATQEKLDALYDEWFALSAEEE
ncbi:ABC-F family ATP-binding cassette domain-containing protein [Aedoeadaptatus acetigenes]|uniref:ABC-F family ATP-binding cassette domain-containing protein n=1 Tax=Aedoeadaptatus acetigenes TaxID=2981723 RepID=A0ABV1J4Z6_9FIRM|nr:ABC-F family ATP-binding cassette domain-containing protein [Aedoeadaptatus acetigenes]MCU6786786.1 ABC-F family ATP-binding cassette domain-containing protein [Aedoeadaptatus acetigenes]